MFVERGELGEDIFEHPSFLQYLRTVIDAMREQVGEPRYFALGDSLAADNLARKLARDHGLNTSHPDDLMHLCADLGLTFDCADAIRRAVKTART